MIELNLQMFAKGGSGSDAIGAGKNITKQDMPGTKSPISLFNAPKVTETARDKTPKSSGKGKGEIVTGGIVPNAVYEVYEVRNGKEFSPKTMTGKEIMNDLSYRPGIGAWKEKDLGSALNTKSSDRSHKYVVRRKR